MKKDKVNNNQENPKGPQTDGKFQHIDTRCKVDRDVHFWEQSGSNTLKLQLLKKSKSRINYMTLNKHDSKYTAEITRK